MSLKVIASLKLMLVMVAAALGLSMSANAQIATDELKEYRSETGGFEVTYPNDWSVSVENKDNSFVVFFESPKVRDDDVNQAARIMVCSTPIDEKAWNDCTEHDSHLSENSKNKVRSRKEFDLCGLKFERVETVTQYDDAYFYYARFSSNGRKFFVSGDFRKNFNLDCYAPIFDQMLENFRFLSTAKPSDSCNSAPR